MRKYIEETKVAVSRVLVETKCDLCGAIAKQGNWNSSFWYEIDETEIEISIRHKDGSSLPEGGSGTEYVVDMCPKCFKDKLIPWLESEGCNAKRREWNC